MSTYTVRGDDFKETKTVLKTYDWKQQQVAVLNINHGDHYKVLGFVEATSIASREIPAHWERSGKTKVKDIAYTFNSVPVKERGSFRAFLRGETSTGRAKISFLEQ